MKKAEVKDKVRVLVLRAAYKAFDEDCYEGFKGTIQYCNTCCNTYRIQFDGVGNNERLENFRLKQLRIIT